MTLLEQVKENIANCVENGYDMPESAEDFAAEMIEQGAIDDDVDMSELLEAIKEARS